MKNSKGFTLVPVLIILALAAVGVYFYVSQKPFPLFGEKPEPDSKRGTANWQTYRNEQYGFEVKYPGDWKFDSQTIDSVQSVEDGFNRNASYIQIYPPDYLNTFRKIELVLTKTSIPRTADLLKTDRGFSHITTLGDYLWAVGSVPEGPGSGAPMFSFIRSGTQVQVFAWDLQKDRDMVDQILSTFKFIK